MDSLMEPPPVAGVIVACTLFPILAIITVALRFCTRHWYRIPVKADDWLMLVGLVFSVGSCACGIVSIGGGTSLPLTHAQQTAASKASLARQVLYIMAEPCIKCSIILFYLRIFPTRNFRLVSYAVAAFTITWTFAFIVASFVQCTPTATLWDKSLPGSCINVVGFYTSKSVTNVTTDIIILIMPCPMVWKLQLPARKKVQLIGVFALGGFACLDALIQLGFIVKAQSAILTSPYYFRWIVTWSALELSSGIACACLVTLGPMFRSNLPPSHNSSKFGKVSRYILSCGRDSTAPWDSSTAAARNAGYKETGPSYGSSISSTKSHNGLIPKESGSKGATSLANVIELRGDEGFDLEAGRPGIKKGHELDGDHGIRPSSRVAELE